MKKVLLLIVAMAISCCAFAQSTIIKGDMNGDGKLTIDDVTLLTDDILHNCVTKITTECGYESASYAGGYEFVDFGLPSGTLWATCNIGANSPVEYGDYFAWGETIPQANNVYTWASYKWMAEGKSDEEYITKYFADEELDEDDFEDIDFTSNIELEAEDDAATVNWGSDWQIPNAFQMDELLDGRFTTFEMTRVDGVYGLKITGKKPGYTEVSIFLPAAGERSVGSGFGSGNICYYWTRTLSPYDTGGAYAMLSQWSGTHSTINDSRYYGLSVRPVRITKTTPPVVPVTAITLNYTKGKLCVGDSEWLEAYIEPSYATDNTVIWSSSDESVVTVNQKGEITGVGLGTAIITATAKDGSGVTATCKVTVMIPYDPDDTREYVDLGLPSGTLWATCNIGAKNPEEYGDYFAWGEVDPQPDNAYSWASYEWMPNDQSSGEFINKYQADDNQTNACWYDNGTFVGDGMTELEENEDVATYKWDEDWQMPSKAQIEELCNSDYTTTTWTTVNGVNGRLITSNKDSSKSVFLPAAGYHSDGSLKNDGAFGTYWSRSLNSSNSYNSFILNFTSSSIGRSNNSRCSGRSVRPVRVARAVTAITLSQSSANLEAGETMTLTATVKPTEVIDSSVTWTSSNEGVATVSAEGVVTAVFPGTATITATAKGGNGVTASCTVTVTKTYHPSDTREYVDLGLPSGTLWATCNIGAATPEAYGDYFAWGEVDPQWDNAYSWASYKWMTEDKSSWEYINKYQYADGKTSGCWYNNGTFVGDGMTELESADDAATANWGSDWQMPTKAQIEELYNSKYTTTTWTTVNGVKGRLITSNKDTSKSIFLPAAGYCNSAGLKSDGSYGTYWSRSLFTTISYNANILNFTASSIGRSNNYRYCGRSVRPVRVDHAVTAIILSQSSATLKERETMTLTATVKPADAIDSSVTWSSNNESVATVNEDGVVKAIAEGTATITAIAKGVYGVTAVCTVTVTPRNTDPKEYVDLDLPSGTLWATCNIGAKNPEESGEYFAWGEIEPKASYSWSSYSLCMGTFAQMTKYCTSSAYGIVDNLTELESTDDAATDNWGKDWQMPSIEQIEELLDSDNTTISMTTQNGVSGMKVASKKDSAKSIFLPAAGYRNYGSLYNGEGSYWSRSLYASGSSYAYYLGFHSDSVDWNNDDRCNGRSVRPVRVSTK